MVCVCRSVESGSSSGEGSFVQDHHLIETLSSLSTLSKELHTSVGAFLSLKQTSTAGPDGMPANAPVRHTDWLRLSQPEPRSEVPGITNRV
jgi:hypothetical protein